MIESGRDLSSPIDKIFTSGEAGSRFIKLEGCGINTTICPDCRVKMVRLGACFSCPVCGVGNCG